ncbi:murein L,D-transpeptidase catalytic domain family protein [Puia sp. P3]|uniref:murein L,D-transpeptidase catalytic domain family protein n=1 Tax=Puia sp. P3 TaxID=3423952 RepID=UPI003D66FE7D
MVVNQAVMLYSNMKLEKQGLDPKAFEYAWRGYYHLLKKGLIRKRTVLSICDFSQSCCSKRMYVIDVQRRKLLFRTYVAHGQNSGEEYATSFSNEPDSYKSSLGFYVTDRVYYGRNGLSLRLNGVDTGYNDLALKRNIVLHGSTYVGDKYMQNFGTLGTSLGCPALPSALSGRIIRAVRNGSCLFIYHPTQQYLENSTIINS